MVDAGIKRRRVGATMLLALLATVIAGAADAETKYP